jgi:hypothetical protein
MATDVEPLDPNSDKGREVAERLSITLAHIRVAIAARKAAAARQSKEAA